LRQNPATTALPDQALTIKIPGLLPPTLETGSFVAGATEIGREKGRIVGTVDIIVDQSDRFDWGDRSLHGRHFALIQRNRGKNGLCPPWRWNAGSLWIV